jgi:hypothetical protein
VGIDLACLSSSVSFCDTGGMLDVFHNGGGTPPRMNGSMMAIMYPSPRQQWVDHGSTSQKAHASGRTTTLHVSSSGRQAWGGGAPEHNESHAE